MGTTNQTEDDLYFPLEDGVDYLLRLVHGGQSLTLETQRCLLVDIGTHLRAEAEREQLVKENRRARVQVPLWKGVAVAMVKRAKRIRCQFGGDHSMADCRCDPYQLGDAVSTMQDELDRAVLAANVIDGLGEGEEDVPRE